MFSDFIKAAVRAFLVAHKALRDDDLRLLSNVWAKWLISRGFDLDKMTVRDFFKYLSSGKLPHPESVRRTRQKLQETTPELRGEKYTERKTKLESQVRDQVRAF